MKWRETCTSRTLESLVKADASPIEDDGEGNIECYNQEILTYPEEDRGWSKMNWLFAECYV